MLNLKICSFFFRVSDTSLQLQLVGLYGSLLSEKSKVFRAKQKSRLTVFSQFFLSAEVFAIQVNI